MPLPSKFTRFLTNTIHSPVLEKFNPLQSPVDRTLGVYLPPSYYDQPTRRYPVVYVLHGYDGHAGNWMLVPDFDSLIWQSIKLLMKSIGTGDHFADLPCYALIDRMIAADQLPEMIIVQPDASLHIPVNGGLKTLDGERATKGSFYVNSPYAGNYTDYLIEDVIPYIDHYYRTIPDRTHRALIGGSMGGYGALYVGAQHATYFSAIGALSPANVMVDLLSWELVIPLMAKLLGQRLAQRFGGILWQDILQTHDILFSADEPLMPSLKWNPDRTLHSYNAQAAANWHRYDVCAHLRRYLPSAPDMRVWVSCDTQDEYGLFPVSETVHRILGENRILHHYTVTTDERVELSPHAFGIAFQVAPALKYCSKQFYS